mgnify:CR=1 FL=1
MSETITELDIDGIKDMIPHRAPMLLIDRVREIVINKSAIGVKAVSNGEPFFRGHFPDYPIMPGVLIIEAMAQTAACVACITLGEETRGKLVFFTTIENARFRKPVRPGDLLELHVEKVAAKGPLWKFKGIAKVSGKMVSNAAFSAMIVDPGK